MDDSQVRSKVCNELAMRCQNLFLESIVDEIVEKLNNNIEVNHFLACLNNRLAILIGMRMNIKGHKT